MDLKWAELIKIVATVGFSQFSTKITDQAGRLPEGLGAELIFVNVINQLDIGMVISMTDRYSHITVNHMAKRQEHLAEHYNKGLSN